MTQQSPGIQNQGCWLGACVHAHVCVCVCDFYWKLGQQDHLWSGRGECTEYPEGWWNPRVGRVRGVYTWHNSPPTSLPRVRSFPEQSRCWYRPRGWLARYNSILFHLFSRRGVVPSTCWNRRDWNVGYIVITWQQKWPSFAWDLLILLVNNTRN